jgi:hypothetical protein
MPALSTYSILPVPFFLGSIADAIRPGLICAAEAALTSPGWVEQALEHFR